MLQYIVILWAAINISGAVVYMRDTIRGRTKPNRVTRLMRSIAPLIATAAALTEGVRWAVVPVFMSGFGPFLIFLSSFVNRKSYRKLKKFDYICGLFSVLALVGWRITNEPLVAIGFSIISDFFALLSTLKKTWRHPETESPVAFITGLLSATTGFFALKTFSIAEIAFPIYLCLACTSLIFAFYRKRIIKNI